MPTNLTSTSDAFVGPCSCFSGAEVEVAAPHLELALRRVRAVADPLAAALIPHGPWDPCGQHAAAALGRLSQRPFKRIVCLTPGEGSSATLPSGESTATANGGLAYDTRAIALLGRYSGFAVRDGGGALPSGIPGLLRHLWPDAQLVPVGLGPGSDPAAVGEALRNVLDEDTFALATFNMWGEAPSELRLAALLERSLDARGLERLALELDGCGTEAALALVHAIGPGRAGQPVSDCAWQTAAGPRASLAALFPGRFPAIPALSPADRAHLGALASDAVAATVQGRDVRDFGPLSPRLEQHGGAFVTLRQHGKLRGCMGRLAAPTLARAVVLAGHMAAQSDPRFRPLREEELATLDIEVSVLGPFVPITDREQFVPGRHGLMLTDGICRGLLLPQVATEHGMDRGEFLEALAQKAGLPRQGWREGRLERFGVEAFKP